MCVAPNNSSQPRQNDLTLLEDFLRWRNLVAIVGSIGVLCWWNQWATYLNLSEKSNAKMLFLTIVMGGLFWVAYWYVKFNWTPPQSWTSVRPKEAIGLGVALIVSVFYVIIIRCLFFREFLVILPISRKVNHPPSRVVETFFWAFRFILVFFPTTRFLER